MSSGLSAHPFGGTNWWHSQGCGSILAYTLVLPGSGAVWSVVPVNDCHPLNSLGCGSGPWGRAAVWLAVRFVRSFVFQGQGGFLLRAVK